MMTARNPEQRKAMCTIRARLYAVNSYYAYLDFKAANPKGRQYDKKGNPKPYNPYTLSPLTNEASEHYTLSQGLIWSDEKEARSKAYLMRLRRDGTLDRILDWEKTSGKRYENNPWRCDDGKTDSAGA